jgi:cysteine desulfurase
LEEKGFADISYLPVDENGILNIKELKKAIQENTILVSVAYVNGEIGVVQNIREIAKSIRHYRKHNKSIFPYFHTDAVQAVNYFDLNVQKLGVDFMTINASKIYGPKKIGALYKKANIEIDAIITGGSQEFGLRAGTENVPYIVGFAEAVKVTQKIKEKESERLAKLSLFMEKLLKEKMSLDFVINGDGSERAPHIINISIPELSSEEIVLRLDAVGIKVSVKSACKSGEYGDSHVIRALRSDNTQSIRFSFGRATTKKDIEYVVEQLVKITDSMQKTFEEYIN